MSDGIGLAEALLGLDGLRVLAVHETNDELVIAVETTATVAWCAACGARAEAHDRLSIEIRDLPCFGRPARLVWRKRRWRCREQACDAKTWTERSDHVDAQRVITRRAGREACRQVGELARPVSSVADEFGVCWWTVMNAVVEHGAPLVDDPDRVGPVRQLGIDETSFLAATPEHATVYATGLVDLKRHVMIDMVEGNSATDLRRWTTNADAGWLAGIKVVATDLTEHFRAGLSPGLAHARRVADPMLLLLSSSELARIAADGEDPVDVACDVALQAAHRLSTGLALADSTLEVGACDGVPAQPDEHDAPQRHVRIAVPAAVQSMPLLLARRCIER